MKEPNSLDLGLSRPVLRIPSCTPSRCFGVHWGVIIILCLTLPVLYAFPRSQAEDCARLLDYLGWKGQRTLHIVGLSLGGYVRLTVECKA